MPQIDFNCRFQFRTADGFGYSQTLFVTEPDYTSALLRAESMLPFYRDLMDPSFSITNLIVSNDLPTTRDSVVSGAAFPLIGTAIPGVYNPQSNVALLVRLDASPFLQGRKFMHGVPTEHYPRGDVFAPDIIYQNALNRWFQQLKDLHFEIRHLQAPGTRSPYTYFPINSFKAERMVTRRVGRPFDLPVGRRRIRL